MVNISFNLMPWTEDKIDNWAVLLIGQMDGDLAESQHHGPTPRSLLCRLLIQKLSSAQATFSIIRSLWIYIISSAFLLTSSLPCVFPPSHSYLFLNFFSLFTANANSECPPKKTLTNCILSPGADTHKHCQLPVESPHPSAWHQPVMSSWDQYWHAVQCNSIINIIIIWQWQTSLRWEAAGF